MGACFSSKTVSPTYVTSKANVDVLKSTYDINMKVLGSGSYGKVFLAENKKDRSIKIAIKVIKKSGLSDEDLDNLKSEVGIMQQVDHQNIVKYFETYDDKKFIYLCMELCTGGELLEDVVSKNKAMNEKETACQMAKILRALIHCHSQNLIHRDIKPENIMYGEGHEIKLIDFGFAISQKKKKGSMEVAGTPYYIAPEVLTGVYGKECDIWSLGVCIYQLLSGQMPFDGNTQDEVFEAISAGKFKMPKHFSDDLKDIIKKMLNVDVKKRITARDAMDHPWIKAGDDLNKNIKRGETVEFDTSLNKEVIEALKKYRGESLLKKAAMNVLVKHLGPTQIKELQHEFEKIDEDFSGFLEVHELELAISRADNTISAQEIKDIVSQVDLADNQKINYSEFLAATINTSLFLTENRLEAIFKQFDIDGTGQITSQNLQDAFSKFGKSITQAEINTILSAHDVDNDQSISLEEFKKMMLPKL